jgi:hypothetical protein
MGLTVKKSVQLEIMCAAPISTTKILRLTPNRLVENDNSLRSHVNVMRMAAEANAAWISIMGAWID